MLLTTLIPCEVRYREDLAEVVRKLIIVSEIANLSVTVDSQPPKPTSLPEIVVDTDGVADSSFDYSENMTMGTGGTPREFHSSGQTEVSYLLGKHGGRCFGPRYFWMNLMV